MSWIKMRTNLLDDPRVGAVSMRCNVSVATTLGSLFILWAIADQHTENGLLPYMTEEWLDARVGVPGFSDALRSVGWLATPQDGSAGLLLPEFDQHNGSSAKRRANEASRKGKVRKLSASDADTMQTPCGTRAEQAKEKSKKSKQAGEQVEDDVVIVSDVENAGSASKVRHMRALTLLSSSPIANRNRGEASKLLGKIAKHRDPCTFFRDLLDRADRSNVVKKGGWMMTALREEAASCD